MKLSERLQTVASYVRQRSRVVDVGTDHGYIPIYLVKAGVADSAIAMDVKMGPLKRAQNHIRMFELEDRITTRLSNGLEQLQIGDADTVIIAGLGGDLLMRILEGGKSLWDTIDHWILSPQSEIHKTRRFLSENGFAIKAETMVFEDGKFYTIMSVVRGNMDYQKEIYYRYGKELIINKDAVLKQYLQREKQKLKAILLQMEENRTAQADDRYYELVDHLKAVEETNNEMQ